MLARRNWLLKASIFINAAVLLYFASNLTISKNGTFDVIEDAQLQTTNKVVVAGAADLSSSSRDQADSSVREVAAIVLEESKLIPAMDQQQQQPQQLAQVQLQPQQSALQFNVNNPDYGPAPDSVDISGVAGGTSGQASSVQQEQIINYAAAQLVGDVLPPSAGQQLKQPQPPLQSQQMLANTQGTTTNTQVRATKLSTTLNVPMVDSSADNFINDCLNAVPNMAPGSGFTVKSSSSPSSSADKQSLSQIIQCNDQRKDFRVGQKGDFWVLYNYVPASRSFHCWESITYTTHADFTFLDNLQPLVEHWRGPISLALYAPGTDFGHTLNTIRYLRKCTTPLIAELVTFHIYFGSKHVPKVVPPKSVAEELPNSFNCSSPPPWKKITQSPYRTHRKLLYPVNVGRNIARGAAETYYILPSDIELYPSPGIIGDFLEMIRRQDPPLLGKKPKVFSLAIFEVEGHAQVPTSKKELVTMLRNNTAITFHKRVCPGCHNVPKSKEWTEAAQRPGLHVFHIGKRLGNFVHWEPIFIGTNNDPFYDERLSWEGRSDKMTQGYVLCVLDYEFHLLDNAFLVHKPGIKTLKRDTARDILTGKTNALIRKVIFPELKALYGVRKGCAV